MKLLFNENHELDVANILLYIDQQCAMMFPDKKFSVDANKVMSIVHGMTIDFPCTDGINGASSFKKVAHFLCYFCAERPVETKFPSGVSNFFDKLIKIQNHENAFFALNIAIQALQNGTIHRNDAEFKIEKPIEISEHSFIDIVDAISDVTPSTHYKLMTVFLEQLVYKTNPSCQYEIISFDPE